MRKIVDAELAGYRQAYARRSPQKALMGLEKPAVMEGSSLVK